MCYLNIDTSRINTRRQQSVRVTHCVQTVHTHPPLHARHCGIDGDEAFSLQTADFIFCVRLLHLKIENLLLHNLFPYQEQVMQKAGDKIIREETERCRRTTFSHSTSDNFISFCTRVICPLLAVAGLFFCVQLI